MCGCDCCQNGNPTCYDPAQRGSRKWLCRCDCGNCIARVLDAHESWAREDERMSEQTRWYSVNEEADFRVANARAIALRDAVEAVRLSPSADIDLIERSQVIAEIEALNNQQEAS